MIMGSGRGKGLEDVGEQSESEGESLAASATRKRTGMRAGVVMVGAGAGNRDQGSLPRCRPK